MDQVFKSQSAHILLIDSNSTRRQCLSDIFRKFDFRKTKHANNGKEGLTLMINDQVDWIIMPLLANDKVNAIHILKIISENPTLKNTRLSLLVAKEETYCLPLAFELGLLSYHPDAILREVLEQEFSRLLEIIEKNRWDTTQTSAEFLRRHLKENKYYKSLLSFEKKLAHLKPGSTKSLINIAEASLLSGDLINGKKTLDQITLIDPKLKNVVEHFNKEYDLDDDNEELYEEHLEAPHRKSCCTPLGIDSCVIVDPDSTVLYGLGKLLHEIEVSLIMKFEKGKDAWDWIKENPEPHLIILEWRVPDLSSLALLQRLKSIGYISVPVVVISSLIKPKDLPILRELGVSGILEKPFDSESFFEKIIWTLQQHAQPTEKRFLELKIKSHLKKGQIGEAERLKSNYMNIEDNQESAKIQMEAEFAYGKENYKESRDLAIKALELGGNSLMLNDLLGKCLLKLGQDEDALAVFEKAQSISPESIERLCTIAEIYINSDKLDQSEEAINKAKDIDAGNHKVVEKECVLLLARKKTSEVKKIFEAFESLNKLVSCLNTRGVTLTRSGKFEEGRTYYNNILSCLSEENTEERSAVKYNLGLANAKYGELDAAIETLNSISDTKAPSLSRKINSLQKRVSKAIRTGDKLELKESTTSRTSSNDLKQNIKKAIEIRAGDLCCFKIFSNIEAIDNQALELLNNPPEVDVNVEDPLKTIERLVSTHGHLKDRKNSK